MEAFNDCMFAQPSVPGLIVLVLTIVSIVWLHYEYKLKPWQIFQVVNGLRDVKLERPEKIALAAFAVLFFGSSALRAYECSGLWAIAVSG